MAVKRALTAFALGLTIASPASHAGTIAAQNFNALSDAFTETLDSLPSGSSLTNQGSYNIGGPGLDFRTYWLDTRGFGSGPVITNDPSDFIGVNSAAGANAPDVAPNGTAVTSGAEHNFKFNDGDGRLDLVFEPVDLSGFVNRTLSLSFWINDIGYEGTDFFFFTLSDGINSESFLDFDAVALGDNASADDGTANWKSVLVDLDALIGSGFGEQLVLTVTVDTNGTRENIFIDDVLFAGDGDFQDQQSPNSVAEPSAMGLFAMAVGGLGFALRRRRR